MRREWAASRRKLRFPRCRWFLGIQDLVFKLTVGIPHDPKCWLEDGADTGIERVGEFHSPPKGYLEWHSHATSPHLATTTSLGKLVIVDKVHCLFALLAQGWPGRLIVCTSGKIAIGVPLCSMFNQMAVFMSLCAPVRGTDELFPLAGRNRQTTILSGVIKS